jgi:hypothetical protein
LTPNHTKNEDEFMNEIDGLMFLPDKPLPPMKNLANEMDILIARKDVSFPARKIRIFL